MVYGGVWEGLYLRYDTRNAFGQRGGGGGGEAVAPVFWKGGRIMCAMGQHDMGQLGLICHNDIELCAQNPYPLLSLLETL